MFSFRDGLLTLIYTASFMVLMMFWSSLPTMLHSPSTEGVPKLETGWSRRTQRWGQINNEENQTTHFQHLQRRSKGYTRIGERPGKNGADSWQGGKHGGYGQRRLWKEIRRTFEPINIQSLTIWPNNKTEKQVDCITQDHKSWRWV